MKYNFNEIEAKWQKYWRENKTFKAENNSDKPKYYVLDMFPYPSGAGLHVGHPLGYIASDIYSRFKRHQGFNVLHPMGYDSFGLPAEQYAIQTGQHPAITTEANITRYREQLDKIGFSFDWSREVRTSNPDYYKWTQWIFIQLFNSWYNVDADRAEDIAGLISVFEVAGNAQVNAVCDDDVAVFTAAEWNEYTWEEKQLILLKYRLTYLAETEVNWCPALGTVLANDEIVNGVSERGGHPVVRKKMMQWSMRITAYAQRLLDGLDRLDWPQPLKESQTNWIGRSKGASVKFKIDGHDEFIEVFTTRPDTIFGVTFMTLAPELDLVKTITTAEQEEAVESYIEATAKRSERDRMADVKTISGAFTGAYAIHPFTEEKIPIWIGDYVLASYGTGAVMAVPCGDQRDHDFANHFNIPIKNIFEGVDITEEAFADKDNTKIANSDFITGLGFKEATQLVIERLEAMGQGEGKINYRLRDAVFSRQRYWGEPFPVYYKKGMPQMIEAEHLPIRLPEVEKYLPTETGEPPLGNANVWAWDTDKNEVVSNDLIDNETVFPLELNTMPGWAGSSWYFNRYMDATNENEFASQEALNYWKDVDLYIGGSEHATGHLLYSRFWQKFLFDRELLPVDEYAKKLINQGMILGTSAFVYRVEGENKFVSKGLKNNYKVQAIHADVSFVNASDELDVEAFKNWRPEFKDAEFVYEEDKYLVGREVEKMSKSKYNVVNPDDICEEYGADTLRLYEMFLGPLEQAKPWNTAGITGVAGFLKKLWRLYFDDNGLVVTDNEPSKESLKTLHKTIKKATEDVANFSFNTSVSGFMIAVNELTAHKCHERAILEPLAILISPYAPHIAEELWASLGHAESISMAKWPEFDEKHLVESSKEYPVSFNGKMRFKKELPLDLTKEEIEKVIMADERTQKQLNGRTPKKVIVVPGKIINIVG
ncbi:leucine--tRNA ligase [Zhouia amylolytica]|uniref:Leucine--tRNA ligase n=1 Tax=Zhouia amylolytica AD3 TaxID=1286632 RepID=W2UK93_9FLAO|nr:leucine--tRNA ligase [Zhouia amylolytica]ETN94580.1 leucyl-tRNA synthetase [Zhouia amylolytica AD3]